MKLAKTLLLVLSASTTVFSQDIAPVSEHKSGKGQFYFTWGYHRDQYTKSTIRFVDRSTDNYDFTFHDAKAKDQPDLSDFVHTRLTVPQFVINGGYFFKGDQGWGIEFSWDHLKYVVRDNQMMHLTGDIRGKHYDLDTLVTPSFVHYEHTNGNNYAMISLVKKQTLLSSQTSGRGLHAIFKVGAGVLVPKTDSRVLGGHNDGPFQISGLVFGASAGLRYNFLRYFYLEGSVKASLADYTHAKLINDGKAHQKFGSLQEIGAIGFNFPL